MSLDDDGHGPRYGCNYNHCGGEDPHNCPFTRDEPARPVEPLTYDRHTGEQCQHEWRQVITAKMQLDLRFFCIHCLVIIDAQEKQLYHISVEQLPQNMV